MKIGIVTRLVVERNKKHPFFATTEGEKWISNALELAVLTCIPSVENLGIKPTYWFILVDSTLQSALVKKIYDTFSSGTSVPIRMVFTDGWSNSSQALKSNFLAEKCTIQVRLDYDDMLHKSFVEVVVKESALLPGEKCVISPTNGICRELIPQRFAQISKKMPPFLALYRSRNSEEMSIFTYDHDKWPLHLVHELRTIPLWVQTITGKNIANRFGRGWNVESIRHLKRLNMEAWTGESRELTTSTSFVRLINCAEIVRDFAHNIYEPLRGGRNWCTEFLDPMSKNREEMGIGK